MTNDSAPRGFHGKIIPLRRKNAKGKSEFAGSVSMGGKSAPTPKAGAIPETSDTDAPLKRYKIVEVNQTQYAVEVEAKNEEEAREKASELPLEEWNEFGGEVIEQKVSRLGIWQPSSPMLYGSDWSCNNHTNQVRSLLTRLSELTLPEVQKMLEIYSAQTKANPLKKIFTEGYAYGNLQRQAHPAVAQDAAEYVGKFLPPLLKRLDFPEQGKVAADLRAIAFYTFIAIVMREDLSKKDFEAVTKPWLEATSPWTFPEPTARLDSD